jgi:hypothetical protein
MTTQLYNIEDLKAASGNGQLTIANCLLPTANCLLLQIIIGTDFYYSVNIALTQHQYYSYNFKDKDYE